VNLQNLFMPSTAISLLYSKHPWLTATDDVHLCSKLQRKMTRTRRTTSPMATFSLTDFELLRSLRLKLEEVDYPNL
jgi:hypothetical protein